MEIDNNESASTEQSGQLARLSDLEFEMEEGQPDIIGWAVVDDNGDEVAKVNDLLVDLDSGAIVMAAIEFSDRQTLIPIEAFALDVAQSKMILPVEKTELDDAPLFNEETDDVAQFFDYWEVGEDDDDECGCGCECECEGDGDGHGHNH